MADPTILDTRMRQKFRQALRIEQDPPPAIGRVIETVPSTARIERYPVMTPVRKMKQYKGYREFHQVKVENIYTLENLEWDLGFEIENRNIQDAQGGEYDRLPSEAAQRMRNGEMEQVQVALAAVTSGLCFDGTAMAANSHTFGTGDNLQTKSTTDASGSRVMVACVVDDMMKPILWQRRSNPRLESDAGSTESKKNKKTQWWVDMEGVAGYGWWWDLIHVTFDGIPTISEAHTAFAALEDAFHGFYLEKADDSDSPDYPHHNKAFNASNLLLVCDYRIERRIKNAVTLDMISDGTTSVDNEFKGFASTVSSAYLV